jgi:hypothetical protein
MRNIENKLDAEKYNDEFPENFRQITRGIIVDDSIFENDHLRGFYNWWNSTTATPPLKNDFDVVEHRKLIPNFFFIQVHDADSFQFVLAGEEVIQLVGRNQTGRRFHTEDADLPLRMFAKYLNGVVRTRRCWRCTGNLALFERGHVRFESMDCPLTDDTGSRVTHVIGAITRL